MDSLPVAFDDQFKKLCMRLQDDGKVKQTSEKFSQRKDDFRRVKFLLKTDAVNECIFVPGNKNSQIKKSSTLAIKYREDGNRKFQKKEYSEAVELYTKSVRFAPTSETENNGKCDLALAYANRSAALFYMDRSEDSKRDIESALDSAYPAKLRHKLYSRKGHCLKKQGQIKDAVESFEECKMSLEVAEIDSEKKSALICELDKEIHECQQMLLGKSTDDVKDTETVLGIKCDQTQPCFVTDNHNSTFPSLSGACEVTYQPDKGRHLVANRDISPGEMLLVEQPYASVLLPECGDTYCHHCYCYCISLVPCPRCPDALYCSAKCAAQSMASYHQYECGLLSRLHKSGVGKFGHLAVRTVLKTGFKFLQMYREDLREGKLPAGSDPVLSGCNLEGLYLPTDYHTIHQLVTHDTDRAVHDLFRRAAMAVFLLKFVQQTAFFRESSDYLNLTDIDVQAFVGGLLLSHLQAFPCNAHEIAHLELNPSAVAASGPVELGAGIYSTLSLFNHSCDPAVNRNFYGDTCVVRSIKTIRKGEEISDNYGAVYAIQAREERHNKLEPQYYFQCGCVPCTEDWPLYPALPYTVPQWQCTECHHQLNTAQRSGTATCDCCQSVQDLGDKQTALKTSQEKYAEAFESLLLCDISSALPVLLCHFSVLQETVCLPWMDYNNFQEAIKQCYSIMANRHITN